MLPLQGAQRRGDAVLLVVGSYENDEDWTHALLRAVCGCRAGQLQEGDPQQNQGDGAQSPSGDGKAGRRQSGSCDSALGSIRHWWVSSHVVRSGSPADVMSATLT